ncbi:MAG TPA: hypothetical protein VNN22_24130 [Verrucomicrobiae bacterium]|nr:hypothetical protein [Verrucomicrobiae bacterium]
MKIKILILSSLVVLAGRLAAQTNLQFVDTTTLTTNVNTSTGLMTITNVCTNAVYTVVRSNNVIVGDTLFDAFTKFNLDFIFVESQIASNSALIAANTNTITAYNLSNAVLSSKYFTLFSSNNFVFTGSNYLGSFPQLQSWNLIPPTIPGVGLTPGGVSVENLILSTNGGASWFTNTTGILNITNTVLVSVVGESNSAPGAITLYGIDHPELNGRTNYSDGQFWNFPDPITAQNPATKNYVDVTLANALSGQFGTSRDTNGINHSIFSKGGLTVIDVANATFTIANSLSKSGTNLLLNIAVTNLVVGWSIKASTNLALLYAWPTFTNYTTVTNSGIVTFTIPILPTVPQYFFWPQAFNQNTITITPPMGMLNGAYYPSNTWSLYSVTNGMANMSFSDVNSNGVTMTRVFLSNGVAFFKTLWP